MREVPSCPKKKGGVKKNTKRTPNIHFKISHQKKSLPSIVLHGSMPPKKAKNAPVQSGASIKAFFSSTTPLKNITNSAPAPATTAPPVRAKTGAVRNLKLHQIQGSTAGSGGRAAQMPGSPPGEDDVLHSGTGMRPLATLLSLPTLPIFLALCELLQHVYTSARRRGPGRRRGGRK